MLTSHKSLRFSKPPRKAQASIEFFSMVGIALLVFTALLGIIVFQHQETFGLRVKQDAQDVCSNFATAVSVANSGGSGFSAYITLPNTLNGANYTLRAVDATAHLTYGEQVLFCRLSTSVLADNPIPKGARTITNIGGTINVL